MIVNDEPKKNWKDSQSVEGLYNTVAPVRAVVIAVLKLSLRDLFFASVQRQIDYGPDRHFALRVFVDVNAQAAIHTARYMHAVRCDDGSSDASLQAMKHANGHSTDFREWPLWRRILLGSGSRRWIGMRGSPYFFCSFAVHGLAYY